jgi:hypothetical protein
VQSTTVMRLKSAGAPPAEVEKEQKTLEKMRVVGRRRLTP